MLRRLTLAVATLLLAAVDTAAAQGGGGGTRGRGAGTAAGDVPSAARAAIAQVNERWMAAFNKGDAAALGALYTADAQVMAPGAQTVTGPQGAQAVFEGAFKMGVKSARLETAELLGGGQMVTEIGRYTMMAADEQVVDTGRYIVVWKREGSGWKLHRDIWNSDRAPAGQ